MVIHCLFTHILSPSSSQGKPLQPPFKVLQLGLLGGGVIERGGKGRGEKKRKRREMGIIKKEKQPITLKEPFGGKKKE